MPFQVSLCASLSTVAPVTVTLPYNEVILPCVSSITLTAVVTAGRPQGHNFLWELISGSPVDFTTPVNQLVVSCDLPDSTDRMFYFWIDKGRAKEIKQIFWFRGTATDRANLVGSVTQPYTAQSIINGTIACSSVIGSQDTFGPLTGSAVVVNPTSPVLMWSLPVTDIYSIPTSVQVEQDVAGVWTTVATILPTAPQYFTGAVIGAYYRIRANYQLNNQPYYNYSCPYPLIIDISNYNVYAVETVGVGSITMATVAQINYTLITSDSTTAEIYDIIAPMNGSITTIPVSQTNYTLISSDNTTSEIYDVIAPISGSITATATVVSYFGGIVIGGG